MHPAPLKSEAALLFNNLSDNLWALEDTDS